AIERHAMLHAAICCKTLFESSYFRTEDKLRGFNHSGHGGVDLWLDFLVLRFQVKKRYHCLLLNHSRRARRMPDLGSQSDDPARRDYFWRKDQECLLRRACQV